MEKLRILITNNWRYITGGVEIWQRRLAQGLIERGHKVVFGVRWGSRLFGELQGEGFEVHAFPMRGDVDPRTVLPMRRLIRERQIDIILAMRERDFRLAGLASKLAGRGRVVVRLRSVCGHDRGQWRRDFQFVRQRWRYRYFASRVITNSEMGKRDLVEGGWLAEEKVVVIRNGLDLRLFDPDKTPRGRLRREYNISEGATVITLIGRITKGKGQIILAQAAGDILKRHPDAFFLFVGNTTDQEYCRKLVEQIRQSSLFRERMILTGFRDDVPSIFADTDILVLPSEAEGLPNVVLEAMAMRCPVIATDVGGTGEVLEDSVNGFLLRMPIQLGHLCDRLGFLLTHPEERKRLGSAGRRKVQAEFDLNRSMERYEALFYKILEAV